MESFFHSLKDDQVHGGPFLMRLNSVPNSDGVSGTTTINACTQQWGTDHPLTMNDEPRKTSLSTKPRERSRLVLGSRQRGK